VLPEALAATARADPSKRITLQFQDKVKHPISGVLWFACDFG
jgi:hypothetical protein